MIYQHRLVISRGGRLSKRHEVFQGDSMKVIESHGSVLVGAWEVWIGAEAGSSVYQIRQFDSLADWEQHQQRMRDDAAHDDRRVSELYTLFDFCDTSILRLNPRSPALPRQWPSFDAVQGQPRGVFEQRTIWLRPNGDHIGASSYATLRTWGLGSAGAKHRKATRRCGRSPGRSGPP